ncbi:hypothetical protein FRC12_009785 [Ceratobasidium sp. 428]|nr:hypothetical protein FRC12_009785 [Ceratobasidium sp. 428]
MALSTTEECSAKFYTEVNASCVPGSARPLVADNPLLALPLARDLGCLLSLPACSAEPICQNNHTTDTGIFTLLLWTCFTTPTSSVALRETCLKYLPPSYDSFKKFGLFVRLDVVMNYGTPIGPAQPQSQSTQVCRWTTAEQKYVKTKSIEEQVSHKVELERRIERPPEFQPVSYSVHSDVRPYIQAESPLHPLRTFGLSQPNT